MDLDNPLFSERILDPTQLAAIGCVAVESARLDDQIRQLLPEVCEMDEKIVGYFMSDTAPIGATLGVLRDVTIHKLKDPKLLADFQILYAHISDLIAKRNTVTHGDWEHSLSRKDFGLGTFTPKTDSVAVRKHQPKSKVKASDVMAIARQISKARRDLLIFLGDSLGWGTPP